MENKFLIVSLFFVIIGLSFGCIESKNLSNLNETKIATPEPTISSPEQPKPAYDETEPIRIKDTFETWSRGYWSNTTYDERYFRVITNYNTWIAFLDEEGYFAELRGEGPQRLEGELFPGYNKMPKKIEAADFNNYFIIAAMMGRKPSKSLEIEIKNISRLDNHIKVIVHRQDSGFGASVITAPYHIIVVKRELLPEGNSVFSFIDTGDILLGKLEIKE